MELKDIPRRLFDEFSVKAGSGTPYKGTARLDTVFAGEWLLCEIDRTKYPSGHDDTAGAIGYCELGLKEEIHCFAAWGRKPLGSIDSLEEPEAVFCISAGIDGRSATRPQFVRVLVGRSGFDLTSHLAPLLCTTTRWALELAAECHPS